MIFTPDNVKDRFRDRPFQPVRLVTTTGQTYDIFHPNMVWVGRTFLMVGTPTPDDPSVFDRATRLELVHLTEMRDLPPLPTSSASEPAA